MVTLGTIDITSKPRTAPARPQKKQQQGPPRKQKQKKDKKKQHRPPRGLAMSECARKYRAAVQTPFSPQALGACLPYPPDRDSLKVTTLNRFALTVHSGGTAAVYVAPCLSSDSFSLWATDGTAAFAPFVAAATNTAPAGWFGVNCNSPFQGGTLISPGALEGRVVSVGLRVTYTGSVSSMAGTYSCYVDPAHACVNSATFSAAGISAALETRYCRITDRPFEQGFTIVNPAEQNYAGSQNASKYDNKTNWFPCYYPWSQGMDINCLMANQVGAIANGGAPIIFLIQAATAGSTFYVEYVQHLEFVGKAASYGLTVSHNDHNAANMITAGADRAAAMAVGTPGAAWSNIFSAAFRAANSVAGRSLANAGLRYAMEAGRAGYGRRRGQLAQVM